MEQDLMMFVKKYNLMKYLQEIKEYAVEAFNTDKDNYQKYKK